MSSITTITGIRWHEERKFKKRITSYGEIFFILSYFVDSR